MLRTCYGTQWRTYDKNGCDCRTTKKTPSSANDLDENHFQEYEDVEFEFKNDTKLTSISKQDNNGDNDNFLITKLQLSKIDQIG